MIANIIKILQAELLDELDIINKDYELDDIPSVILPLKFWFDWFYIFNK